MESVETAMSSKSNSVETARSAITSKHASPAAGNRFFATSEYQNVVTSEVLGVEEDEGGLPSKVA